MAGGSGLCERRSGGVDAGVSMAGRMYRGCGVALPSPVDVPQKEK